MTIELHKVEINYKSGTRIEFMIERFSLKNNIYKWSTPGYNNTWLDYLEFNLSTHKTFKKIPNDTKKKITENLYCNIINIGVDEIESIYQFESKIFLNINDEVFNDIKKYYYELLDGDNKSK